MTEAPRMHEYSKIKEVVSGWPGVRQFLRGGDAGQIVPVVVPRDRRRYGWLFLLGVAIYLVGFALFVGGRWRFWRPSAHASSQRSRCCGCGEARSWR